MSKGISLPSCIFNYRALSSSGDGHLEKRASINEAEHDKWINDFAKRYPLETKNHEPKISTLSQVIDVTDCTYNIGLGWDCETPINADLIAVILDNNGNVLGTVTGLQTQQIFGPDQAIIHAGDCRVGGKEAREKKEYGENENIIFHFQRLPRNVACIVVGVYYDWFRVCTLDALQFDSYLKGDIIPNDLSSSFENDSAKSFSVTHSNFGKLNGFIAGKFSKIGSMWLYVPLQIPLESRTIEQLIEQSKVYFRPSLHILDTNYSELFFECDANDDDYVSYLDRIFVNPSKTQFFPKEVRQISFDRWNNCSEVMLQHNVEMDYDNFFVFTWKSKPKSLSYSIGGDKDSLINYSCKQTSQHLILCRVSRSLHLHKFHYSPTQHCFFEFFNMPISEPLTPSRNIQQICQIGEPVESCCLSIIKGIELSAKDYNGFSDPYVKIKAPLGKKKKITSKIIKKTLNPEWDFTVPISTINLEKLYIQVWDWDMLSYDDYIGTVFINDQVTVPCERVFLVWDEKKQEIGGGLLVKIFPTNETAIV